MGKYDFVTIPNRIESNSTKWQAAKTDSEIISLSIADMDFCAFDVITNAIVELSKQQVFGYDSPKDSLYKYIIEWEKSIYNNIIDQDDIIFISGVMPAISVAIQEFSKENEEILTNSPVYQCFSRTIKLCGRKEVHNPLIFVNNRFEIDFDSLEETFKNHNIKIYLFCSPHNPIGRVWKVEELTKVAELCKKYGVLLVSDEIHRDLTIFGNKHTPFNNVSKEYDKFLITLSSATKTFNIAGIKNSYVVIKNEALKTRFKKRQLANNQHEISNIGLKVTEAVYTSGKDWLFELKGVIEENINFLVDFFERHLDKARVIKPEATYLVWVDFSKYNYSHEELLERLNKVKLVLSDGAVYGIEGRGHFRINVGTPKKILEAALLRIKEALSK